MNHRDRPPLALQLVFLGKHLDHLIEHKLAVHGLNRTQALTLMALKRHEGLNAMALCAHARVEPANVTRTLQSLERLDLVERRPHPTDGRVQIFYLTAGGRSTAETVEQTMMQISSEILDGVDEEELRGLKIGLHGIWRTMRKRLEAYRFQPSSDSYEPSAIGLQQAAADISLQQAAAEGRALGADQGAEDSVDDNSHVERR